MYEYLNNYNELYGDEQLNKYEQVMNILNKSNIRVQGEILDLGCGTGLITKELGQYGKVFGIEPEENLLKQYKGKKFLGTFWDYAKLNNKKFDFIFCFTSLHHDKTEIIPLLLKNLKKDGYLVVSFLKQAKNIDEFEKEFKKLNCREFDIGRDKLYIIKKN